MLIVTLENSFQKQEVAILKTENGEEIRVLISRIKDMNRVRLGFEMPDSVKLERKTMPPHKKRKTVNY